MSARAPRICSCGRTVAAGAVCPCRQHRKAVADKARPGARARGYGAAWEKARAGFLRSHPRCVCGDPATVVDHLRPHKGDRALFWDSTNWRAMCGPCHSRKTAKQDGGFGNKRRAP